MDSRAQDIFAAGRAVLPELPALIGDKAAAVEHELRPELERDDQPWRAAVVYEILREHPATRAFLEARVPGPPPDFENIDILRA